MPVTSAPSQPSMCSEPNQGEGSGVSRRGLIAGVGLSALAGFAGLVAFNSSRSPSAKGIAASTARSRAQGRALATAEMDSWTGIVGSRFEVAGFVESDFAAGGHVDTGLEAGRFVLELAGVEPLRSLGERPPEATRDRAFVAVFDVLSGGQMPGDLIYSVTSPSHALDIFLTRAANAEFPNRMHAVFN